MIPSDDDLTNKHVTNDDDINTVRSLNLDHGQDLIYCQQTIADTIAAAQASSQGHLQLPSSQLKSSSTKTKISSSSKSYKQGRASTIVANNNNKEKKDGGGLRLRRPATRSLSQHCGPHEGASSQTMTNIVDYDPDNADTERKDQIADFSETEEYADEHESLYSPKQKLDSPCEQYNHSKTGSKKKSRLQGGKHKKVSSPPGKHQELANYNSSDKQLLKCLVANSSTALLEDVPLSGDSYDDTSSISFLSLCHSPEESSLQTATQIFIPFIIAGCGTVGAGMVLDNVQHWDVFKHIDEIYILLPALLGLKGNLEMTLASRLSTHANLGDMNSRERRLMIATGNIALTQCQATIVSLLACILAFTINFIYTGSIDVNNIILITAAALLTAAIASLLLGLLMIVVVFVAQSYNINPDNIATPIAASLGDLITLSLYAFLTDSFYAVSMSSTQLDWFSISIICIFILLIPVWATITRTNKFTRDVLYNGWTPILAAMIISSISGVILNVAVSRFTGIAVFHPVICGVGGNLVAVQASRLSTDLHKSSPLGILPEGETIQYNPITVIFGKNSNAKTSRLLLAMAIPGHLFFAFIIATFESGHMKITSTFLLIYSFAAELQIVILLYLAYILTRFMWCKSIDPDNSSIPYLTAFGDFFGTTFLSCAFMLLHVIHGNEMNVKE